MKNEDYLDKLDSFLLNRIKKKTSKPTLVQITLNSSIKENPREIKLLEALLGMDLYSPVPPPDCSILQEYYASALIPHHAHFPFADHTRRWQGKELIASLKPDQILSTARQDYVVSIQKVYPKLA